MYHELMTGAVSQLSGKQKDPGGLQAQGVERLSSGAGRPPGSPWRVPAGVMGVCATPDWAAVEHIAECSTSQAMGAFPP